MKHLKSILMFIWSRLSGNSVQSSSPKMGFEETPSIQFKDIDFGPFDQETIARMRSGQLGVSITGIFVFTLFLAFNIFTDSKGDFADLLKAKLVLRGIILTGLLGIFLALRFDLKPTMRKVRMTYLGISSLWMLMFFGLEICMSLFWPEGREMRFIFRPHIQTFIGLFGLLILSSTLIGSSGRDILALGISMILASYLTNLVTEYQSPTALIGYSLFVIAIAAFSMKIYNGFYDGRKREFALRSQLSQANVILQREMKSAREIQRSLLPLEGYQSQSVEIDVLYQPCDDLSGDFFDFAEVDDKILFYVADVTSHGAGAAQVTYLVKGIFNNLLSERNGEDIDLEDFGKKMGQRFVSYQLNHAVGVFLGLFDPKTGTLTNFSSNIPFPVVIGESGFRPLDCSPNPPFLASIFEDSQKFATDTHQLAPGETLYVFTDGAFEVMNPKHTRAFGEKRLMKTLHQSQVESWQNDLKSKLYEFSGKTSLADDLTVMRFHFQKEAATKGLQSA